MSLPRFLYRGDNDKKEIRKLRETLHHRELLTNLLNGGNGSKIFSSDFISLINDHILEKFDFTHFLSFTESLQSAYRFGLKLHSINDQIIEECCEETYDYKANWNFAIMTIDTSRLTVVSNTYPGIYECSYTPELYKFKRNGLYRVILIDATKALDRKYQTSIEYALFDNEWLILPATPVLFENGAIEYSGILDGACISSIKLFDVNQERLDCFNTIDY